MQDQRCTTHDPMPLIHRGLYKSIGPLPPSFLFPLGSALGGNTAGSCRPSAVATSDARGVGIETATRTNGQ